MDDNQQACLGFCLSSGVGPMTFMRLIEEFGSPSSAFFASSSKIQRCFRTSAHFEKFITYRSRFDPDSELKKMENENVWVMTQYHKDYPKHLKEISDPPIALFGKGDRNSINFNRDTCIGIVGTRHPTAYGKHVAEELGKMCAANGIVVISGMATGIDTISHKAAIDTDGRTAAVQGTGIDMVYPPENKALHEQILKHYGVVLSEYPIGHGIARGQFVLRNRIVVGLSKAILVVEGGIHSGSLITARYAAENGRDVYALPGQITSDMSQGPHILLREGAHILTGIEDLMRELGMMRGTIIKPKIRPLDLFGEEKNIYELLTVKKYHVDEIGKKIALPVSDVLPLLSLLEVRGVIAKGDDGMFTAAV